MRVVVIFPGALGDLCLLAPGLAMLAARGTQVDVSVRRALVPVARMLLPTSGKGPPADGAAMASLFGAAIDPGLARWLAGADHIHAWLARGDADGSLRMRLVRFAPVALHAVPRDDGPRHASEEYGAALAVDAPLAPIAAVAPPSALALPWRDPPRARLVLHPGAGARAKMWSRDGFLRVAEGWRAAGGEVAVLLGPAEEHDRSFWEAARFPPFVGLTLVDAAALVASAQHWIGNDSGMSHLAGAFRRHGVVVFRTTRPARWRPLGAGLAALECDGRTTDAVAGDALALLRTSSAASVP